MLMIMKRLTLIFAGLLALAACSALPITIDLLPLLGDEVSGEQSISAAGDLDLRLPADEGVAISGYEAIEYKPATVSLDYGLNLAQDGGLEGEAEVAFYLAAPGDYLWDDDNLLGDPQRIEMDDTSQVVEGVLSLNQNQIDALVGGEIVVGARITGNVTGSARVSYEFTKLTLEITFF